MMKSSLLFLSAVVAIAVAGNPQVNVFVQPSGLQRLENVIHAIGFSKNSQNSRIVGGGESVPHSRPYQAALFLKIGKDTGLCGGSLITKNTVLTAAHCKYDGKNTAEEFIVTLGAHNIFDMSEGVRIQTKEAIMHPEWDPVSLKNDVCILKLPVDVQLNDKIQLSVLPPYKASSETFEGEIATVSGWGRYSDRKNEISEVLQEVDVQVVANSKCNKWYFGSIVDSMICTSGANKRGSCGGDSGGPLVVEYNGQITQIGIVSFGFRLGCEIGFPSVYTRVTSHMDWITKTAGI